MAYITNVIMWLWVVIYIYISLIINYMYIIILINDDNICKNITHNSQSIYPYVVYKGS